MTQNISIELTSSNKSENNIEFDIKGTSEDGLHKSIINGLRRVLLSMIPTIGFRTEKNDSDIIIEKNTTSLHNEYLLHRISLVPLYINPEQYEKQYLFYLNVQNTSEPIQTITSKSFNIYPLKKGIDHNLLDQIKLENYEMNSPLNENQKKKIFRPFQFKGNDEYCILTELKSTKSSITQELILYGVPSISYAHENARWQAVSCAAYSFKKNEDLFNKIVRDKIEIEKIEKENEDQFAKELFIKESERYFYRDKNGEPFWYSFKLDSVHFKNSKELFIQANELIIDQLELINKELPKLSTGEDTIFTLETINDDIAFKLSFQGYDDTIGNIIQSHISMNMISDESILATCGYKKRHPLQEVIDFYLSLNPNNKIFESSNEQKIIAILQTFQEACGTLIPIFSTIKKEAIDNL